MTLLAEAHGPSSGWLHLKDSAFGVGVLEEEFRRDDAGRLMGRLEHRLRSVGDHAKVRRICGYGS